MPAIVFAATSTVGSIVGGDAAERVGAPSPGRRGRRASGGRCTGAPSARTTLLDVVVGGLVALPGGHRLAQLAPPPLAGVISVSQASRKGRPSARGRARAGSRARTSSPPRRTRAAPDRLEVAVGDVGQHVVGHAGRLRGDPAGLELAVGGRAACSALASSTARTGSAIGSVGLRHEYWICARRRGEVVGREVARGEDRLVERPGAPVREHGLLRVLGGGVHESAASRAPRRARGEWCRDRSCPAAAARAPSGPGTNV